MGWFLQRRGLEEWWELSLGDTPGVGSVSAVIETMGSSIRTIQEFNISCGSNAGSRIPECNTDDSSAERWPSIAILSWPKFPCPGPPAGLQPLVLAGDSWYMEWASLCPILQTKIHDSLSITCSSWYMGMSSSLSESKGGNSWFFKLNRFNTFELQKYSIRIAPKNESKEVWYQSFG